MARKPKATGDPSAPKRKMTHAEQSALFIRTARDLGAGETEEEFERAFSRVITRPSAGAVETQTIVSRRPSRHSKNQA